MDYRQARDYISGYTDYEKQPMPHDPAFYDLRRVVELLAQLGNPHRKAKSVHITGTNAKGSVAVMVASALTASGYTTGLYTSPHLRSWRERIKVDDELISEEEFVSTLERVRPVAEEVNRRATYGKLTTFELLTVLAFAYFGSREVGFQVLEVGMGGRFDATSVINPEVCILTPISLEHTDVLGKTVAAITAEKAAIIKPGCVLVTSPQTEEADRVIEEARLSKGVKRIRVGRDVTSEGIGFNWKGQRLRVDGRLGSYELSIPLLGRHQVDNAAVAVAALEALIEKGYNISRESIISGLAQVKWPGRLQVLRRNPILVVDGAHNVGAARVLKESLKQYFKFDRAILVIGISRDKDIASIVSELYSFFNKVIVTCSHHPRAGAPERIAAEFRQHGVDVQTAESIAEAIPLAKSLAGKKGLVCVAGSLFIVAEAIEQIDKTKLPIEW